MSGRLTVGLGLAAAAGAALLSLTSVRLAGEQAAGSIQGLVRMAAPPPPAMLEVTADQPVCGTQVRDETILTDPSGGVANAVIVVSGLLWTADPSPAVINNKGCLFAPRVQIARPKKALTIASEDNTLHTTHLYDHRNRSLFNIALPLAGMKIPRPNGVPFGGVMRIECDSHNWMRGWLFVTDEVAAASGRDGRFRLDGIPAGTYQLTLWHEKLTAEPKTVRVTEGETTEVTFMVE